MDTVQEILDTDIPRPSWVFRPGYNAPLPSNMSVTRPDGSPPAARTLNPETSRYTTVPADTARIYGPQQALIVHRGSETETVPYSADPSQWTSGGATIGADATSVIEGKTAKVIEGNGNGGDLLRSGSTGTLSGGWEVVRAIIEANSGSVSGRLRIRSTGGAGTVLDVKYDPNVPEITAQPDGASAHIRKIDDGPNGEDLLMVQGRYDPSAKSAGGDDWEILLYPDNGGNGSQILHFCGRRENRNFGRPIATGSSQVTRNADDVSFDQESSWWNPNEGTFLIDFAPMKYYGEGSPAILERGNYDERYLHQKGSGSPASPFNYQVQSTGNGSTGNVGEVYAFQRARFATSFRDADDAVNIALGAGGDVNSWQGTIPGHTLTNGGADIRLKNRVLWYGITYIPGFLSIDQQKILVS